VTDIFSVILSLLIRAFQIASQVYSCHYMGGIRILYGIQHSSRDVKVLRVYKHSLRLLGGIQVYHEVVGVLTASLVVQDVS